MHSPGKRPIEYLQPEVDFVGLDGDRRGDAEYSQAAADGAGHHAELEAFAGHPPGALGVSRPGPAVPHQVETEQPAAASHVAQSIAALLPGPHARVEPLP